MTYEEEDAKRMGDLEQKVDDLDTLIGGVHTTLDNEMDVIRKRISALEGVVKMNRQTGKPRYPTQMPYRTTKALYSTDEHKVTALSDRGWLYIDHGHLWVAPIDWPRPLNKSPMSFKGAWEEYCKVY